MNNDEQNKPTTIESTTTEIGGKTEFFDYLRKEIDRLEKDDTVEFLYLIGIHGAVAGDTEAGKRAIDFMHNDNGLYAATTNLAILMTQMREQEMQRMLHNTEFETDDDEDEHDHDNDDE